MIINSYDDDTKSVTTTKQSTCHEQETLDTHRLFNAILTCAQRDTYNTPYRLLGEWVSRVKWSIRWTRTDAVLIVPISKFNSDTIASDKSPRNHHSRNIIIVIASQAIRPPHLRSRGSRRRRHHSSVAALSAREDALAETESRLVDRTPVNRSNIDPWPVLLIVHGLSKKSQFVVSVVVSVLDRGPLVWIGQWMAIVHRLVCEYCVCNPSNVAFF